MTNPEDDLLLQAKMARLLGDDDAIELPEDEPTELVSDATKEKAKKAGRFAVLGGKWAVGKAKDLAQATAEKTKQAKEAAEHKLAQQREAKETKRVEEEARQARERAREAQKEARLEEERQELEAAEDARGAAASASTASEADMAPVVAAQRVVLPVHDAPGVGQATDAPCMLVELEPTSDGGLIYDGMGQLPQDIPEDLLDLVIQEGADEAPLEGLTSDDLLDGVEAATPSVAPVVPAPVVSKRVEVEAPPVRQGVPAQRASIPRSWLLVGGGVLVVAALAGAGAYFYSGNVEDQSATPPAPVAAPMPAPVASEPEPVVETDVPAAVEEIPAQVALEPAGEVAAPVAESTPEPVPVEPAVRQAEVVPEAVKETPAPAPVVKSKPRTPAPAPSAKAPAPKPVAAPKPAPVQQPKSAPKKEEWQEKANQDIDAWAEQLGL